MGFCGGSGRILELSSVPITLTSPPFSFWFLHLFRHLTIVWPRKESEEANSTVGTVNRGLNEIKGKTLGP